jgi:hypothetical protein
MVVHNPEDQAEIVMVEALEKEGTKLWKTGHTLTASPSDIEKYEGDGSLMEGKGEGQDRPNRTESAYSLEQKVRFSSDFGVPDPKALADGFNEYGVRENYSEDGEVLESVDVVFRAMEPGPPEDRNGFRITEDFLDNVAVKEYSAPPFKVSHQSDALKQLGRVENVFRKRDGLYVQTKVPNTGASAKTDAIADFTHNPPALRDGSLGFGRTFKVEMNEDGEPMPVDGKISEFSVVSEPGGYDDGGVEAASAFKEALTDNTEDFDDGPNDGVSGSEESTVSVKTIEIL